MQNSICMSSCAVTRWRLFGIFVLIFIFCLFSKKFPKKRSHCSPPYWLTQKVFTNSSLTLHNASPYWLKIRKAVKNHSSTLLHYGLKMAWRLYWLFPIWLGMFMLFLSRHIMGTDRLRLLPFLWRLLRLFWAALFQRWQQCLSFLLLSCPVW